jgi:hypothetical protein
MAFRSDPLGPAPGPSSALTTRNVVGVIRRSNTSNASLRAFDRARSRDTARPRRGDSRNRSERPHVTKAVIPDIMARTSSEDGIRGRMDTRHAQAESLAVPKHRTRQPRGGSCELLFAALPSSPKFRLVGRLREFANSLQSSSATRNDSPQATAVSVRWKPLLTLRAADYRSVLDEREPAFSVALLSIESYADSRYRVNLTGCDRA